MPHSVKTFENENGGSPANEPASLGANTPPQ